MSRGPAAGDRGQVFVNFKSCVRTSGPYSPGRPPVRDC